MSSGSVLLGVLASVFIQESKGLKAGVFYPNVGGKQKESRLG